MTDDGGQSKNARLRQVLWQCNDEDSRFFRRFLGTWSLTSRGSRDDDDDAMGAHTISQARGTKVCYCFLVVPSWVQQTFVEVHTYYVLNKYICGYYYF